MKLYDVPYAFPQVVIDRVAQAYPHASTNAISTAFAGFLQYVDICKAYPDDNIPMFSESVDEVWHQLIMDTRSYQVFCEEYVGFFLHHIPNGNDTTPDYREEHKKLKMLWILACQFGNIDPAYGSGVAALFLADQILGVDGAIDAKELRKEIILDIQKKAEENVKKTGRFTAVKNFFRREETVTRSGDLSYDNLLTDYLLLSTNINASVASEPAPSYERLLQDIINNNSHDINAIKHSSSHDNSSSSNHSSSNDSSSNDHSSSHSQSSHSTSSHSTHSSSYHSCGSSSSSSHSSCSSSSCSSSSSSSCSSSSCSS